MRRAIHRLVAQVIALGVTVAPATALTVTEWAQALDAPRVAGKGIDASGRTLSYGHLDLKLQTGMLYPIAAGDRVVGGLFVGQGSFRYTSTDPREALTYRRNVERASKYAVDAQGGIGDTFDAVVIMTSGDAAALGGAGWAEGEPAAIASARLKQHLDEWKEDRAWRFHQLLPEALVDPPATPLVTVELDGSKHDVAYNHEPIRDLDESLAVMEKTNSDYAEFVKNRRYPSYLSTQPLGRDRLVPRPLRWVLTDLDVELVNPEAARAKLTIRETVTARAAVRVLAFRLRKKIVGTVGVTARVDEIDYRLAAVTDAAGAPLPYSHIDDDLVVELPRALAKGETFTLRFELSGDILYRPGRDSYWQLGTGSWYPSPQRWAMEGFTYHAVVKAAGGWIPFSTGNTVRRWEEGGLTCAEFRAEKPMQGAAILAGKYITRTDERDGLTVRVSSYAMANDSAAKTLSGLVHSFVKFYEPLLGPYPFREVDVIEINELGFGQAPAGIIYITQEAFSPGRDDLTRLFSQGINARLAHEVAHGWWGHVALLSDLEDQWISEAVAEYYSALAMRAVRGNDRDFKIALNDWRGGARDSKGKGTVFLANFSNSGNEPSDRFDLMYNRGALMLAALHEELGDNTFFTIMKSYLRSFERKPAFTSDLIGITSYITKRDFAPWFERYLLGTEVPEVSGKPADKKPKR